MMFRRPIILLLLVSLSVILGNDKGCEKPNSWEHPAVEKGMTCADCHEDGRTVSTLPKGHGKGQLWEKEHGRYIKKYGFEGQKLCNLCHTASKCTTCHQQEKPRSHNAFWRLRGHGLNVGLNRSQCMTCHKADFCQKCHSETSPLDHNASWGASSNRHCLSCHFPITTSGAQKCAVCHVRGTTSHTSATPTRPNNALHQAGANCRDCHTPLRHPDNGMSCTVCHTQ